MLKIKYKLHCLLGGNHKKYLKKHNIFGEYGDNVLYQPDTLPNNPKLVKFHNNIMVASGVTFYEHDVINSVFVGIDKKRYRGHLTCIEVMDNVFIGGKSIIVGNVRIGPNAIVGAGSVVTKDVPEGTIVAGNPAKVIGKFDDLHKKRKEIDCKDNIKDYNERYEELWKEFYEKRKEVK